MQDDFNENENRFDNLNRLGNEEHVYSDIDEADIKEPSFSEEVQKEKDIRSFSNNKSDKKLKIFFSVIVSVLVILVLALAGYIFYFLNKDTNIFNSNSEVSSKNSQLGEPDIKFEPKPADENELSASTIYTKVSPCVVGVVVYDSQADIISDPISQGSGIIVDEKGYIVTNSHVVNNSKKNNIKIVLNTNEELLGKVVGYDSKTDIAVIKCEKSGLPAAVFGDSDQMKVGESALALGNPLGLDFASSLTRGIISAVNRPSDRSGKSFVKLIQTDTAINPGNSGGPLINMYGQIIGINSSKIGAAGFEGMGFAIPSNTAKSVINDIISMGYVTGRVRLGLVAKIVSNYQAQIYNVPVGVVISEISSDSNLRSSGAQVGDIITKINGVNITSFDSFYGELYSHKPGENVTLSIFRSNSNRIGSSTFDINVTLLEDRGETQDETASSRIR